MRCSAQQGTLRIALRGLSVCLVSGRKDAGHTNYIQGSTIVDKPARRTASRRTWCEQIGWTLSVLDLRANTDLQQTEGQTYRQTDTRRQIIPEVIDREFEFYEFFHF